MSGTTGQIIDEIKMFKKFPRQKNSNTKLSAWSLDHKPFGKLFFAAAKTQKMFIS